MLKKLELFCRRTVGALNTLHQNCSFQEGSTVPKWMSGACKLKYTKEEGEEDDKWGKSIVLRMGRGIRKLKRVSELMKGLE